MKGIIFLLALIIFVSGCIQQENSSIQEMPNKTEEIQKTTNITEEVPEIPLILKNFKPYDYRNVINITLNISHPLLYYNMRWIKMPILVKIDTSNCDDPSYIANETRRAFELWENETSGIISFKEVEDGYQVTVKCTREMPRGYYGDVGLAYANITRYSTTNLFTIAEEGEVVIFLLEKKCEKPITIAHELGHILGLGHVDYPNSIMYTYSDVSTCGSEFTEDLKNTLKELYKTQPLPDLYFINVSAVSFGPYVNVSFEIANGGIISSPSVDIEVMTNQTKIANYTLDALKAGWYHLPIQINNINIKKPTDEIRMIIDSENLVEELDRGNNEIILKAG